MGVSMEPSFYQEFALWGENNMPLRDPKDADRREHMQERKPNGIMLLTDVVNPSITFFPVSGPAPHPAVMVCPGGAYSILAWTHEGIDICSWLNSIGFSAFLLKYRCPEQRQAAHADAARALRFIRSRADEFGIDPAKLGILGFSAGGHLAAVTSAPSDPVPYPPADEIDKYSCRPDFTVLVYPAYLADDDLKLEPEFRIDKNTPPAFAVQTEDDGIRVENSLAWFLALKRAGVPCELHVYPEGGHGYGILRKGLPVSGWRYAAESWLVRQAGLP